MNRKMIRVLTLPDRQDVFLVRPGDSVTIDLPNDPDTVNRVTLKLSGGWSESGIAYCHLKSEPIRSGLVQFGEGPKP